MDTSPARRAITAALSSNWEEAVKINEEILEKDPEDLNALMRIARAYFELGNIDQAIKMAEKVLEIDSLHKIATKCVAKWQTVDPSNIQQRSTSTNGYSTNIFLEEPGKTKIVDLINLGDAKIITTLVCGDEVYLSASNHKIGINTVEGKYIGKLPDDIAMRLIEFIKTGNNYCAYIKSVSKNHITIFVREKNRSKDIAHLDSFSRF